MVVGLAALVTMEVTNPSLHMIWIFKVIGLGESRLFLYNAYFFVFLYFVFRIIGCGYFLYVFTEYLYTRDLLFTPIGLSVVVFGTLTALSYYWFSKIVKLMLRAKAKVEDKERKSK